MTDIPKTIYVTDAELRADIAEILEQHPWIAEYRMECCKSCAPWHIDADRGKDARIAWERYEVARLLLGDNLYDDPKHRPKVHDD